MGRVTLFQALILALLQGTTELFPVSSLGHTIIVPALFHWTNIHRSDPTFLPFVVTLHLGTALALVLFYRREWWKIVGALLRSVIRGKLSDDPHERLGWLLVVGTIPVGILGLLLEKSVRALFASALLASLFLIANGAVMFLGEALRRRQLAVEHRTNRPLTRLSWFQAVLVGVGQSFALLPGISRSGASMVTGLLCDLDHADAARYSFMLATPVIIAASLLKVPDLFNAGAHVALVESLIGGVVSGIAAYFSVAFLTRYFRSNDLRPFGWYCLLLGLLGSILAWKGIIS